MTHSNHTANRNFRIRCGTICLSLAFLGGALLWSRSTLGGDSATPPARAEKPAAIAAVQMMVRGPEELVVGQRATLEVFLFNAGTTSVKDLEFLARLDANLEHASKESEHRFAVEPIASEDVQVVRLQVTPRKAGPGGFDLTLRDKNGATAEKRHVWPVRGADSARQPEPTPGTPLVKFKITALKECLADRPCIVLVNVLNTDSKPMPGKLDLVVSYASQGRGGQAIINPGLQELQPELPRDGRLEGRKMLAVAAISAGNPTRQVPIAVPALGAGESQTIPVRLTPRRIGDLGIAITSSATAKGAAPAPLATTRLKVKFDPNMTADQLVPVRTEAPLATRLPTTLAEVPEVSLDDPSAPMKADEAFEYVSHLIEKINHVNTNKTDAFVETLVKQRADVRGLPFVMGDDCRLSPERGQHFLSELSMLRVAMTNPANLAAQLPNPAGQPANEAAIQGRIAALMQVVGPEGEQAGRQAVKYLASLSHVRSTTALAKIAIFAEEETVRRDALAALATRREKDFTSILVAGLDYPWPAVAQRAADAIVQLKRQDLLPQLVAMLERPDPRAPQAQQKDGKQVLQVRELVRINHLRNCLLCHSPVDPSKAPAAAQVQDRRERDVDELRAVAVGGGGFTAPVPLPGQALPVPTPQSGYGNFTVPDTLLVFDVTYLRQDFSVKLPVSEAKPWPDRQRFDFLVRTRELTEKEADAVRALLQPQEGQLSPYHGAALASLRKLTGRDAEPTAAAWRRVLAEK